MGFSSLASSAGHQVLATSFSCILATSNWFSLGIQAAFRRSVVSTNHYSASKGFSVPENTASCSFRKSDTFPSFCFRGKVNSPCRRSCLLSLILHHTLEYPHHIGILPIRTILGRAHSFTTSPSFHDLSWSKRGREGAGK